jgi:hypothetical protein
MPYVSYCQSLAFIVNEFLKDIESIKHRPFVMNRKDHKI